MEVPKGSTVLLLHGDHFLLNIFLLASTVLTTPNDHPAVQSRAANAILFEYMVVTLVRLRSDTLPPYFEWPHAFTLPSPRRAAKARSVE